MNSPVATLPTDVERVWLSPYEPDALPDTPGLTGGQRRVLQACLPLFAEQGFAGSSIRDVAAAAGLQPASLYNHFASKEAMLTALVVMGNEHHLAGITAAVETAAEAPGEQLQALVRAHVQVHCAYSRLALIVNHEDHFLPADARPRVATLKARSGTQLVGILERGAQTGAFTLVAPRVTMAALVGLGLDAARWFPYQDEAGADELADVYAALALRMVGADEPRVRG